MTAFLAGIIVLAGFLGLAYWFSRQETRSAARLVRLLLGGGAVLAGLVLTLRGGAVIGGPLSVFGIGMLTNAFGLRGRSGASSGPASSPPSQASMTLARAREILGVDEHADEAAIRSAHRSLMKKLHPDAGGSAELARQVQEARDILLENLRKS